MTSMTKQFENMVACNDRINKIYEHQIGLLLGIIYVYDPEVANRTSEAVGLPIIME